MTRQGYRVYGLWDKEHYDEIYNLLWDIDGDDYVWSAQQHNPEDGQTRRSILVYDEDLANRIAEIGVARIYYNIRVGSMSIEDHKEIGKLLFKQMIPVYVSTSYRLDKSVDNAVWGIADRDAAMFVKLKWGQPA